MDKPVKTFYSNGLQVCVWRWKSNTNPGTHRYNVTVTYQYKKEDKWQKTEFVPADQLPSLGYLTLRAAAYIDMEKERNLSTQLPLSPSTDSQSASQPSQTPPP